ncbi:MAG: SWIM zinc finger family protein, partial [Pseudomonadota bacterium]|nr:SWIM zinc finger family protein [Pseudomonadota bacterium]
MIRITNDDIRAAVTNNAFAAGRVYHNRGRVLSHQVLDDGATVQARVQGTERQPYKQTIHLKRQPGGRTTVAGSCSCPVAFNCKHVAAVLFAVQADGGSAPEAQARAFEARDVARVGDLAVRGRQGTAVAHPAVPAAPTLPPDLTAWLSRLERAREDAGEDYAPDVRRRVVYVLSAAGTIGLPELRV